MPLCQAGEGRPHCGPRLVGGGEGGRVHGPSISHLPVIESSTLQKCVNKVLLPQ